MARGDRVTWRLEIAGRWGGRLDPTWLPSGDTDGWRRIFETEDLAGRVFAAGGGGLKWAALADAAASIASVLEQYRMQWRVAEQVSATCPVGAAAHLGAMVAPAGLRPPRRTRPAGRWRVCTVTETGPVVVSEHAGVDLAEGTVVAHRTLAADEVWWAEPVDSGVRTAGGMPGWVPRADTGMRLAAFAAEESVATFCAAATTGHTGPDVLSTKILSKLGMAAHRMILEYRTLLRSVWTDMDACPLGTTHDADADALLKAAPDTPDVGPGGRWRHALLVDDTVETVSEHDGRSAAAASVAAYRGIDEVGIRWAEPLAARA